MVNGLSCLACGSEISVAARFCSQCGARKRQHALAAYAGLHGERAGPERRQLTVLFCDLVASTKLSMEIDAEDFANAISDYRDASVRVVRHWKGYVSRYVGDGILAYFGYPRASEDDALRAVAAAWELAQTVAGLRLPQSNDARRRGLQSLVRVRVGLHTGLAVVGDVIGSDSVESDSALGAAPNIAARLQALARPGEVVISAATAALLPPTVLLQPVGTAAGRSDIGDVRAFKVADVPSHLVRNRPTAAGPFIGRHLLLADLLATLRSGAGLASNIFLCGDPGIGKSRIVQELIKNTDAESMAWVQLACSAYGQTSPLHPFRDWLGDAAAADEVPAKAAAEADAGDGHSTTPYDLRRRTFRALSDALAAHSSRVGLVLEDVHWADSTTIEFIAELLAASSPDRLVVLMTSRNPPAESLADGVRLRVEFLERLLPGDAAALARALIATSPLSAFELAEIVDHADGVPLYIEEFVRFMADKAATPDRIPITLRDSMMGVLDTLGMGRTVALCASVFGRRFDYAHLRELLQADDRELMPAVAALTQAQILVQTGELPDAALEFRHALLRDTAYHTLLKSERERLHLRVAQLAAAGALSVEVTMPELLATHHSLGGSYKAAIEYWLRAHDRAMQRSANVEAMAHIHRGLEDCCLLADEDKGVAESCELELLRRLCAPLIAILGWSTPELEDVYTRAMRLCRSVGSKDAEFELERGLYNMHLLRSELVTADVIANRLVASARSVRDDQRREDLLLVALRSKALPAFYAARYSEARGLLEEVLALYDPTRHASHAFWSGTDPAMLALSYLAWMDAIDGRSEASTDRVSQALASARAAGHVFSICYALCFAASCAQLIADAPRAAAHAAEALRIGNQHNFPYWIAWAKAVQGWVDGLDLPLKGIAQIDEAQRDYLATGSTLVAPYFEALACDVADFAGDESAARRKAGLLARAQETGVWFWQSALRGRRT